MMAVFVVVHLGHAKVHQKKFFKKKNEQKKKRLRYVCAAGETQNARCCLFLLYLRILRCTCRRSDRPGSTPAPDTGDNELIR